MDGVLSQEEINALLNNNDSADSSDEILTESEKDAIGEIANISMGTAATTLFSLVNRRGCEKRIVPKKERPRVYNELKVFLSVIINLQ